MLTSHSAAKVVTPRAIARPWRLYRDESLESDLAASVLRSAQCHFLPVCMNLDDFKKFSVREMKAGTEVPGLPALYIPEQDQLIATVDLIKELAREVILEERKKRVDPTQMESVEEPVRSWDCDHSAGRVVFYDLTGCVEFQGLAFEAPRIVQELAGDILSQGRQRELTAIRALGNLGWILKHVDPQTGNFIQMRSHIVLFRDELAKIFRNDPKVKLRDVRRPDMHLYSACVRRGLDIYHLEGFYTDTAA